MWSSLFTCYNPENNVHRLQQPRFTNILWRAFFLQFMRFSGKYWPNKRSVENLRLVFCHKNPNVSFCYAPMLQHPKRAMENGPIMCVHPHGEAIFNTRAWLKTHLRHCHTTIFKIPCSSWYRAEIILNQQFHLLASKFNFDLRFNHSFLTPPWCDCFRPVRRDLRVLRWVSPPHTYNYHHTRDWYRALHPRLKVRQNELSFYSRALFFGELSGKNSSGKKTLLSLNVVCYLLNNCVKQ